LATNVKKKKTFDTYLACTASDTSEGDVYRCNFITELCPTWITNIDRKSRRIAKKYPKLI
jgi:hypothetical protein